MTCLFRGLEMKQQITEVPVATSRSSIECFLYCLVINVLFLSCFTCNGPNPDRRFNEGDHAVA